MEFDQSKTETKLTEEIMLIFSELGKDKVNEIIKLDTHNYNMVYSYVHKVIINHINELEATIENMKAIAGEKCEYVSTKTAVELEEENTTDILTVENDVLNVKVCICKSCTQKILDWYVFCPNCGRKLIRK